MVKASLTIWFYCIGFVLLAQQPFGKANYWPENIAFDSVSHWGYNPQFQVPERVETAKSWFNRKLFTQHFIEYADSGLFLFIDPMLDLKLTKGSNEYFKNGRGLHAGFVISEKVEAETWLMENQTGVLPGNLVHHQFGQTAVYGYGRSKINKDTTSYDFAWAMARLAVKIKPWWIAEVGYGRQHIGAGYRSLLLSNQTVPYPYLKNTWTFGKLSYSNQLAAWNTLQRAAKTANTEAPFLIQKNKIETVDYVVTSNLTIGYMSGAIWDDNKTYATIEEVGHYLPIPGIINAFGDSLFQLNGLQLKYHTKSLVFYGQWLSSQQQLKLSAYQIGALLRLTNDVRQIFLRGEYNVIPANFYTNQSNSWSNQTYYAGYVGGANKELLFRVQGQQGRFALAAGGNLSFTQGRTKTKELVKSITFESQYTINESNGLAVFADFSLSNANYTGVLLEKQSWVSVGVRTSLMRVFQDY
jgi:hypothetical protein